MDLRTFKYKFIDYDMTAITVNWLLKRKPCELTHFFNDDYDYKNYKFKNLEEAFEFEIDGKKVKDYIQDENFNFTIDLIAPDWPEVPEK